MKESLEKYAPLFLRLGLAVVFALFGYQKLSVPEQTRAEIQLLLDVGLGSASAINYYLGLLELLVALGFLFGVYMRSIAPLASILLAGFFVSFIWKYGASIDPTIYRDLGLLGGSLSLWFSGSGPWSLDEWFESKRTNSSPKAGI